MLGSLRHRREHTDAGFFGLKDEVVKICSHLSQVQLSGFGLRHLEMLFVDVISP
jgi:hypothetical protein